MRLVPYSFSRQFTFKPQCVAVILVTRDAAKMMTPINLRDEDSPGSTAKRRRSSFPTAGRRSAAILTKESPIYDVIALVAQIEPLAPEGRCRNRADPAGDPVRPLPRPVEAYTAAFCNAGKTSTLAVRP
jgi:hypothetical protein